MKKITKAMIFAAGFGKRLVPLTEKTPKPLLQLNGKTLLENCVLFLEDCGIKEIVINVHHLADQIIEFIQKNKWIGYVGVGDILVVAIQLIIGGLNDYGVLSINETFIKYF